jgi:lipopolysaccharide biosynthesis protein
VYLGGQILTMSEKTKSARVIAFYLPQYHPIPENDEWWGRGFTEWTNVARAKPMFRGHYQPHVPADLGFYDLRVPETRQAQADMAREHGVEAFCYWHYWFAGRRIIERPFNEVLKSGEPDFPFCLGWANQSWSGIWHGNPDSILIEQTYPGIDDHVAHFEAILAAFQDPRYFRVEGRPLFYVFKPRAIPELRRFADLWKQLARRAGLPGLYLVGEESRPWDPIEWGFDAACDSGLPSLRGWEPWYRPIARLQWECWKWRGLPSIYDYGDLCEELIREQLGNPPDRRRHPCLIPNWDNTPRSGRNGRVLHGSSPELFRRQLRFALRLVADVPLERRIVFIKSWNEWAEGNHLEPDLRFGHGYLRVIMEEMTC